MSARRDAAGRALRVMALVSDGLGAGGGIAAYNRELLGALAALPEVGRVHVLARHAGAGVTAPTGVVQEAPRRGRAAYAAAALRRALTEPFDWVFCGHLNHAVLARAVSGLCGARLWLQLHGVEAWQAPARPLRTAAAGAGLVTAVSRFTRRRFLAWSRAHPSRVRVLSNTYDPAFTPAAPPVELRRRLAPGGERVILTVSRLHPAERYKGHERVMEALALPALRGSEAPVYVIAGDGDDRARLERRAAELGVAERVRFIGAVAPGELADLYRAADVFAMPSTGEGFGIVFLEAAACGVPVIAGDGDGARDALRDGRVGQLVPAADAGALAAAIARALARRTPPDGFQVFARERFREHLARILAACPPPARGERWC